MNEPRILVAGIGNIFLGDDAFGVEVAQRLSRRKLPDHVRLADFGIRSFDLAYALMDDYDAAILIDATAQGGEPGTVYTLELDAGSTGEEGPQPVEMDAHGMNPMRVLEMVRTFGGTVPRIFMIGCEPAILGNEEEGAMGLSAPVEAAVEPAIGLVERLVSRIAQEYQAGVLAGTA